jgi:general secretion pathway protein E
VELPTLSLANRRVDARFVQRVPIHFARTHSVIGLATDDCQVVEIAMSDAASTRTAENLALLLECETRAGLSTQGEIQSAINQAYGEKRVDVEGVLHSIEVPSDSDMEAIKLDADLLDDASRAPVIKLVNLILFEAVKRRASDVHVQPLAEAVSVRIRIDGILFEFLQPPRHLADEIISRIKVMGSMDIAERRVAQDGRATVHVGDRTIDLRIASLPTAHGERIVLRLLDKGARLYELSELGMPADVLQHFEQLINRSHGILLVTGPTGSGKTTTLYAALQRIDYRQLNVVTLEDPIEYHLTGISQTQVSTRKGMTFATGLRAVLRQDPDVILVGEIRDQDTARMAIQSSLTGHLVLSTLHTNDTASAVGRLLDLGVEPYLVADSLLAILAQRLVRLNCPACKRGVDGDVSQIERLGMDSASTSVHQGAGCELCSHTGYRERRAVFELLVNDQAISALIHDRQRAGRIRHAARLAGMRTLRDEGIRMILAGQTTPEEVLRVTQGAIELEEAA